MYACHLLRVLPKDWFSPLIPKLMPASCLLCAWLQAKYCFLTCKPVTRVTPYKGNIGQNFYTDEVDSGSKKHVKEIKIAGSIKLNLFMCSNERTPRNTSFSGTLFLNSQWAFGAKMTSYQRQCDVITSHRRYHDVIFAPNARWAGSERAQ